MKLAICFVGTSVYRQFFPGYYKSIFNKFLNNTEKKVFVFTDVVDDPVFNRPNVEVFEIEHVGWPDNTLFRYKYISGIQEKIEEFDYFLFLDPDMLVHQIIHENEIFTEKSFIGVQHPSFNNKDFDFRIGTYEYRKESTACIDVENEDVSNYYQGCLWGGKVPDVFELINQLRQNVDKDEENNFRAIWFDESHLNRFLISNKDRTHTLDSGYCYPQMWNISFQKKIIHLNKDHLNIQK